MEDVYVLEIRVPNARAGTLCIAITCFLPFASPRRDPSGSSQAEVHFVIKSPTVIESVAMPMRLQLVSEPF